MNYYELFGLPPGPFVNKTDLAKKYFELQKENHPDYFTQASSQEKEEALEKSAAINKAFVIFQDEEKTLEYFLKVNGVIEEDEKYELSPAFLMEMMELNEAISEDETGEAAKRVEALQQDMKEEIRPVLENYHSGSMENIYLLKLKDYYYRKKYVKRILDRLAD